MAQNITLMGASYSDVPAVQLPKTGGGTALFADPSGVTAAAADVASGKWFLDSGGNLVAGTASGGGSATIEPLTVTTNGTYTAPSGVDGYSPVTVSVSGGGGASNFVQGTFTGTTPGEILEINIPYTGSGYPIAAMIFPKEGGYNSSGTFYTTVQRYALRTYLMVKNDPLSPPTYPNKSSGLENQATTLTNYKSSASSATSYGSALSNTTTIFITTAPSASSSGTVAVRIAANNKMKVFIASTSYGFMAGIEYVYCIVYSS